MTYQELISYFIKVYLALKTKIANATQQIADRDAKIAEIDKEYQTKIGALEAEYQVKIQAAAEALANDEIDKQTIADLKQQLTDLQSNYQADTTKIAELEESARRSQLEATAAITEATAKAEALKVATDEATAMKLAATETNASIEASVAAIKLVLGEDLPVENPTPIEIPTPGTESDVPADKEAPQTIADGEIVV